MPAAQPACPKATCPELSGALEEVLSREWLLSDGLGGFASGSVIGCPTRRYHGLLVASKRPPLERCLLLAGTLDTVIVGRTRVELSTFEFGDVLHPQGYKLLAGFAMDMAGPDPWVEFTFSHERFEASKRITLCTGRRAVRLRYQVRPRGDDTIALEVAPLLAMRDFHGTRTEETDLWDLHSEHDAVWVHSCREDQVTLAMFAAAGDVQWQSDPVWWQRFRYRVEDERGFTDREDLQRAGTFRAYARGPVSFELAGVAFVASVDAARARLTSPVTRPSWTLPDGVADDAVARRLVVAADQFVVQRRAGGEHEGEATILAGYPWFGDWGRDSFIALEGLLLIPGRYQEARQVLATFAGAQRDGLIPNRFDDYGGQCAYNSVDASLWFIHAADAYLRYSDDSVSWDGFLLEACRRVIDAFCEGTEFDIHLDDGGLLCCGNESTQITWMDAACEGTVFTPRHGRPVEVNALWYHVLHVVAQRAGDSDLAERCRALIGRIGASFTQRFWNGEAQCLYDCVRDDGPDASIRPNQIFAVSLPHSPLPAEQRKAVLGVVSDELLTPCGLRSLSPEDYRYHPRFGRTPYERDRSYHNGMVWSWLIGPYVEAHLRVQQFSPAAKKRGRRLLQPLIDHLSEAGLGSISEVFDAEPPHAPRGCPAQAWSVAELLRAWKLTEPERTRASSKIARSAPGQLDNLAPQVSAAETPNRPDARTQQHIGR